MENERKIFYKLGGMWSQAYQAKQELGADHELYEALYDLCMEINSIECKFHKYLSPNQEPDLDEEDRQEQESKKPIVTPITMSQS